MLDFALKQNQPQKNVSFNVKTSNHVAFSKSHRVHPILDLQRSIANQAEQKLLLQAEPWDLEDHSGAGEVTRFNYDFSQILVHSRLPISIQAKLVINHPGDVYEQEADRASEHVMRASTPQPQRSCPSIGGCPDRQMGQLNSVLKLKHLQMKDIGLSDFGESEASGTAPLESDLSISFSSSRISRSPLESSTQTLHSELIEQFRRANGLPPHGIDPVTGQQVGPTDSEIRFGGLLDAWLQSNRPAAQSHAPGVTPSSTQISPGQAPSTAVRGVPAPTRAPTLVGPGQRNVVAACSTATDVGACRQHLNYVSNILPKAIANIRSVSSPYSAAIADLYSAALPAAQAANPPPPGGRWTHAIAGPVTVRFGATTFTFNSFTILLQQQLNGANGQAFGVGGPMASISLNEISRDALFGNLAGIETTMIHETMHIFMEIVERLNRGRTAGAPMVDPNLDRASYATLHSQLGSALMPFILQIRQLPSFAGQPAQLTTQQDATLTADTLLSEDIARTEAAIFAKQRAGLAFGAADLRALSPFFRNSDYWSPQPPVRQELSNFILINQTQIDAAIQPLISQVGERYLNLRP